MGSVGRRHEAVYTSQTAKRPAQPPKRSRRTAKRNRRAPRWARLCVTVGVVITVLAGGGLATANIVADHYESQVRKGSFLAGVPAAERAPSGAPISGPMNILVLGSDNAGNARAKTQGVEGQRSDSIMVFHVNKGFTQVHAFSIERDSYVNVPAGGSWGGGKTKINAALQYGGPSLAIRAVQDLLHIKINYAVIISFAALIKATDAVGGVDVKVDKTTYDNQFHRTWKAGWHHLTGADAQFYVRQRHGLANGDYDRMKRQQQLVRALVKKATTAGVLSNPFKLNDMLAAVTASVTVDDGMPVKDLAFAARDLGLEAIKFNSMPMSGSIMRGGVSYEEVSEEGVQALGQAINTDSFDAYLKKYPPNDVSHGS